MVMGSFGITNNEITIGANNKIFHLGIQYDIPENKNSDWGNLIAEIRFDENNWKEVEVAPGTSWELYLNQDKGLNSFSIKLKQGYIIPINCSFICSWQGEEAEIL